jgi:NNP family nitrate/nitrite transporter-like MFS transporter
MTADQLGLAPAPSAASRRRSHQISEWNPEDLYGWENGDSKIARRNLIWSIFAEHLGFLVWSVWSVMVLFTCHRSR